jgi:predicted RNase H-like nuclease (RuvC/YqgF family)
METLDKLRIALNDRKSKIDTLSLQLRERINRIEEFEKKIEDPETFYKVKMEFLGTPESSVEPEVEPDTEKPKKDYTVALLDLKERYLPSSHKASQENIGSGCKGN